MLAAWSSEVRSGASAGIRVAGGKANDDGYDTHPRDVDMKTQR